MKIVRVIARLNVGGPAKHVIWLTQGLQRPEYESILITGTVPADEDDMGYFARDMGVTPVLVPEMSREVAPRDVISIWRLYKFLLRERPDVVHTHTAKAGTVGRIAGLLYRWLTPGLLLGRPKPCRFVHTYHGHIFHSYYGPLKTKLFLFIERTLARTVTDRIVVISQQQRQEIHEKFRIGVARQFVVIPLGLDTKEFEAWREGGREFREELGLGNDDVLVGIVGRLTEVKNHRLFLEAVALWKEKFSRDLSGVSVRFAIIGDGHLRNTLTVHAQELGLPDCLKFVGSRRDMENVYPALDIVALTSLNEGTPLTLIEAMANARPVISTAVGGVIDLLGDPLSPETDASFVVRQRGISVPSGNASAFADGLNWLVANIGLRRETGERGLQFVARNYSKERLLADIKLLYAALLKET